MIIVRTVHIMKNVDGRKENHYVITRIKNKTENGVQCIAFVSYHGEINSRRYLK